MTAIAKFIKKLLREIRRNNRMAGHDRKKERYRVAKIKGRQ